MAPRYLARYLSTFTRQFITITSYSYSSSSSYLCRLRPLVAAATFRSPLFASRSFYTQPTNNLLSLPDPDWANRPRKEEEFTLDGCDLEHWHVIMEDPEGDMSRDEIIDSYIKTLAMVLRSEEDARQKIYSVSTRHYFAFGALVSEELAYKLQELPNVRWVLPDSYVDAKNKDYGGEPFINGEAVPYDPKYHADWLRNHTRANERNKRNDRPRNSDRSRNSDARREGPPGNWNQNPRGNYGDPSGTYE